MVTNMPVLMVCKEYPNYFEGIEYAGSRNMPTIDHINVRIQQALFQEHIILHALFQFQQCLFYAFKILNNSNRTSTSQFHVE